MNHLYQQDNLDDSIRSILSSSSEFSTTSTESSTTKRVRFGSLEIHEHAVELGGSGVPCKGPPTTLEWEEQSNYKIRSVELFENTRPFTTRKGSELLQTKGERIDLLLKAGFTLSQINTSIRETEKIRKRRYKSNQMHIRFPTLTEAFGL